MRRVEQKGRDTMRQSHALIKIWLNLYPFVETNMRHRQEGQAQRFTPKSVNFNCYKWILVPYHFSEVQGEIKYMGDNKYEIFYCEILT